MEEPLEANDIVTPRDWATAKLFQRVSKAFQEPAFSGTSVPRVAY
jgi:hypothetical protein